MITLAILTLTPFPTRSRHASGCVLIGMQSCKYELQWIGLSTGCRYQAAEETTEVAQLWYAQLLASTNELLMCCATGSRFMSF